MKRVYVVSFIKDDRTVITVFDNSIAAKKYYEYCRRDKRKSLEYDYAPIYTVFVEKGEDDGEIV